MEFVIKAINTQGVFIQNDEGRILCIQKHDINGNFRIESRLKRKADGTYDVLANSSNADCVNGVCPIR